MEHVQSGVSPHRANAADTHDAITQLLNAAHNTLTNGILFFFFKSVLHS